ncbi:hypothetical protein N0V93_003130 [Gnomoniopsis smithogilvyi]|uniref:Uncharacterized protein n=1 Tax=Gnomoniopsis smithogilvyi TaxID=1191159 RepID=A0A9W9CZQ7_9PEZI|nr:hypothetical protein N0V93_003130 [Gnomoniopsis smithogilvyi]
MHILVDMASSPEYLTPSVQNTETIEMNIDPAITGLPHGSCSSIPPSTVSYSTPDPNMYSEVTHISSFDTSPVIDERLLTPVSSAASPQLQERSSCRQSPFEQQQHSHPGECTAQQPTPPHTATMYPYSDYSGSVSQPASSSSMSMPAGTEPSQHDHLLPFLHHPSPSGQHHEEAAPPPPPQATPYFGSYNVSVPQEHDQYYLPHAGDIGPLGLLRQDVHGGGSYTHRPLAALGQQQHATVFSPHQQPYQHGLARLSPTQSRQYSVPRARRERNRKASARRGGSIHRRGSFSPPGMYSRPGENGMPLHHSHIEDDEPDEGVTLDDKTPADLRRLWDTRRKWLGKKGNGMWENIMQEYLGEEHMTENKKTQVKAALQMKIHRMLLKHGKWPERDEAALLRAYKRWEENRYVEILRLYEEEMAGRKKAYDWKSQHIEAELVKMGLEEPERDRDSKARRRKQVAARHHARAGGAPAPSRAANQYQRLPGMYEPLAPVYGHYAPLYEQQRLPPYDAPFAEQIGAHPPVLSNEQNDRLAREILERNPFSDNGEDESDDVDVDIKMELSDYGSSEQQHRPRAASLVPGLNTDPSVPQQQHSRHHSISASPSLNAQRSAAVARQACGEMIKQQQFGSGVGA